MTRNICSQFLRGFMLKESRHIFVQEKNMDHIIYFDNMHSSIRKYNELDLKIIMTEPNSTLIFSKDFPIEERPLNSIIFRICPYVQIGKLFIQNKYPNTTFAKSTDSVAVFNFPNRIGWLDISSMEIQADTTISARHISTYNSKIQYDLPNIQKIYNNVYQISILDLINIFNKKYSARLSQTLMDNDHIAEWIYNDTTRYILNRQHSNLYIDMKGIDHVVKDFYILSNFIEFIRENSNANNIVFKNIVKKSSTSLSKKLSIFYQADPRVKFDIPDNYYSEYNHIVIKN